MKKIMLSGMLSLLAWTLSGAPAFAAELPGDLSPECLDYIKKLPPEVEYDFVQVPEDWDRPTTSRKLHIFYYAPGLHSWAKSNLSPIVYFNGGPGASSHGIYEYFKTFPPAAGVPFLYIDQRGNGCSSLYPKVPTNLAGAALLALYGTRNIVRDAEAIRLAIFPDGRKWSVFGQSFGSAIVHRYIAIAPQALKKAFAHGTSLMTDGIGWVEERMLAQKRVAEVYLQQYPGDEKIMARARELMPPNYCAGNATSVSCGLGLLDQFAWRSLGYPGSWKSLHATVEKLLTPDGKLDLEYLKTKIPPTIDPKPSVGDFMVAVIPGRELPGGSLNTWSCEIAVPRLTRRGEHPDTWFYNECRGALSVRSTFDPFIKRIVAQDYLKISDVAQGLRTNPDLEMHLYSSGLDTFAARGGYREEVLRLRGRIYYTDFAKIGHDWYNAPPIWVDLKKKD